MAWSDQPAVPAQPPYPSSPSESAASFSPVPAAAGEATGGRSALSGARRTFATALLAVGLLTVGGVAVVFAADPSATPAPTTTTQPSTGGGTTRPNAQGGTHNPADCPNMGGSRGSGTAPASPAAPSTDGSTSSPGSNL